MPAIAEPLSQEGALSFFLDQAPDAGDFRQDVIAGLSQAPKQIAPKHFYDAEGSRLFDLICETPEYYVTRTECTLLDDIAVEMAQLAGPDAIIIEFGSGASVKIRRLLDELKTPQAYVAIDISAEHLHTSAQNLAKDWPVLDIGAICADFTGHINLPESLTHPTTRRLGFLPGSTIGNFTPTEAQALLTRFHDLLAPNSAFLIGVDLKKDPSLIEAAYNDATGITAAFNYHLLERMVDELDADLNPDAFHHRAFYNTGKGRIEMHLESQHAHTVTIDGHSFDFTEGETIHTENSYKYTVEEFQTLSIKAKWTPQRVWTDPNHLLSIHWLESTPS
ncbi:MAG: L-histidine N(alpha)-methyltransferase [Parvularculales bacterium]